MINYMGQSAEKFGFFKKAVKRTVKVFAQLFSKSWRIPKAEPLVADETNRRRKQTPLSETLTRVNLFDFEYNIYNKKKDLFKPQVFFQEASPGFEPGNESFADSCLTTWL